MQLGEAMKASAPPPRLPPTPLSVFRASPAEEILSQNRDDRPQGWGRKKREASRNDHILEQQTGQ